MSAHGLISTITSALRRLTAAKPVRGSVVGAIAVVLAATLGFLYYKTQATGLARHNEVLALLRELKEIDARWDVEVFRARGELRAVPVPSADYRTAVARIQQELAAAAREIDSPVLRDGLSHLRNALLQKADLIEKFKKANAATKQALGLVLRAETEFPGLVRGAWQDFRDRERLVAAESAVVQVLAEAQRYYLSPAAAEHQNLDALIADLQASASRLPPALGNGLARLEGHVQQLLGAKPIEQELFAKLAFLPAGPRIDSLTGAYSRELAAHLDTRELYRVYLVAFAGALLILIAYLAARLAVSYRLLNAANVALQAANESLESRVAERTQELSDALQQLKDSEMQLIQTEKMSSLGQMVAGVAHEINTPLAYVKNSVGVMRSKLPDLTQLVYETTKLLALLRAGAKDPDQLSQQFALIQNLIVQFREHRVLDELQELVKDGLHGIEQITDIVTNLRNFARLDRSRVATVNLNDGLNSTLLLAKHELKSHTIKKNFTELPGVTCSPSQINQVFLNLINNAAQSIEPGPGVITLTTRREGFDRVAVEVEDNGKGIPPEVLPKIFDPFFTTKEVGRGTGLGLSIAYKIVEQHGGTISVDSAVGVGTKFTVVLPLTPPTPAELAA
jgi:two-component system, NtrC family, sensor kinase